jgi:N-methylhydantoinase B
MTPATPPHTSRVSFNVRARADGSLICAHCTHDLPGTSATYLAQVPVHVGAPREGGPMVFADPAVYVDAEVVLRQYYCPNCFTALPTEVVPVSEPA